MEISLKVHDFYRANLLGTAISRKLSGKFLDRLGIIIQDHCSLTPLYIRVSPFHYSLYVTIPFLSRYLTLSHSISLHLTTYISLYLAITDFISDPFLVEEGNCVKKCSDHLMTEQHTNKCVPCPPEGCPKR